MAQREEWGTRVGFIMAAMGSAVGLGNIWRFPYMCYKHGGGAFLVPYFVALFVVGIPLMMLEFGLGHRARSGAPQALAKIHPRFSWIGWWAVTFVMFGIVVYYAVVIAWCLCYFLASFTLAWGKDPVAFFGEFIVTESTIYDGEAGRFVFGSMNAKVVAALAIVWFLNWLITFFGIQKGIERASKVFIPLLVVLVGVMVVWSAARFPGAGDGVAHYLTPDWERLRDSEVWTDAFGQIFFTLSLGFGIMIAYASYLPRKSDIPMDASLTCVGNCLFSIFAGFAVFATIGHLAWAEGTTLAGLEPKLKAMDLSLEGPGLVFKAYPVVLNSIPGGAVFGAVFFLALVVAGLSSSISIVEAFTTAALDRFRVRRRVLTTSLCAAAFALGLVFCTGSGLFALDIADHFLNRYGLIVVALLECLIVGWFFSPRRLRAHLDDAAGMRFRGWTGLAMRVVITAVLGFTWYGLAAQGKSLMSADIVGFALLGGIVLVWLDEHWLDVDIKMVIPALLLLLLDQSVKGELAKPYGGYPREAVLALGVGLILATLLVGFGIDIFFRRRGRQMGLEGHREEEPEG
ncbi:MAG: sodium-dependent transporter [bacterium]